MTDFRIDLPTQDGGRQTEQQVRQEQMRLRIQEEVNTQLARLRDEINVLRALHGLAPI